MGRLTVVITGNAEYHEPQGWGTYEKPTVCYLHDKSLLSVMRKLVKVNEENKFIGYMDIEYFDDNDPLIEFYPDFFTIYDDVSNVIVEGNFHSGTPKLIRKATCIQQIELLKKEIRLLQEKASYERWCENFYTAKQINKEISLLNLQLIEH